MAGKVDEVQSAGDDMTGVPAETESTWMRASLFICAAAISRFFRTYNFSCADYASSFESTDTEARIRTYDALTRAADEHNRAGRGADEEVAASPHVCDECDKVFEKANVVFAYAIPRKPLFVLTVSRVTSACA